MPIFMKFEGIPGPVTRDSFEGWIELESCQLGVSRHVTSATGLGTNREGSAPPVSEIVITKLQDSASTSLFRASQWGEGKKVTIAFVNDDGKSYLELKLEETMVANFNVSGHGGFSKDRPLESLSLTFATITYRRVDPPKKPEHAINTVRWQLAAAQLA